MNGNVFAGIISGIGAMIHLIMGNTLEAIFLGILSTANFAVSDW